MTTTTFDDERLKTLVKQALVEVLDERRDLVRDILEEALADFSLSAAIAEDEESMPESREAVFEALQAKP